MPLPSPGTVKILSFMYSFWHFSHYAASVTGNESALRVLDRSSGAFLSGI